MSIQKKEMRETILNVDGVKRVDLLQTQISLVPKYMWILRLLQMEHLSLNAAHEIAEKVHHAIEQDFCRRETLYGTCESGR